MHWTIAQTNASPRVGFEPSPCFLLERERVSTNQPILMWTIVMQNIGQAVCQMFKDVVWRVVEMRLKWKRRLQRVARFSLFHTGSFFLKLTKVQMSKSLTTSVSSQSSQASLCAHWSWKSQLFPVLLRGTETPDKLSRSLKKLHQLIQYLNNF